MHRRSVKKTGGANEKNLGVPMLNESYYNFTNELYCNSLTSFQKTGGARHLLGPMDATPMFVCDTLVHVRVQCM